MLKLRYTTGSVRRYIRRKWYIALCTAIFIYVFPIIYCSAEKIYYKDGRLLDAEILYRSKGSIWVKVKSVTVGVSAQDIKKIEGDDGAISKYDYESLSGAIQDFINQKKYDEAARCCSLLLESFPNVTQIRYLRGLLNQKIGNFSQASEDYEYLIRQGVADAGILNNLGVIYADKKQLQDAQDFFIKAMEKSPDIAEVHNNLADLLLQSKDYIRSINEYNEVINKEPHNVKALYNLGLAYMDSKDYVKAKEQWEKILAIAPENNEAKNALEYLRVKKL